MLHKSCLSVGTHARQLLRRSDTLLRFPEMSDSGETTRLTIWNQGKGSMVEHMTFNRDRDRLVCIRGMHEVEAFLFGVE